VLPANQAFDRYRLAGGEVNDKLPVDHQLIFGDGLSSSDPSRAVWGRFCWGVLVSIRLPPPDFARYMVTSADSSTWWGRSVR
jgi:hypothetical protein